MPAAKAVLDTVVLVSAFITEHKGGASAEVLRLAATGRFDAYVSESILAETRRVLLDDRRQLRRRYRYSDATVLQWCEALLELVLMVNDPPAVQAVERDPNDDMVIACALEAKADLIVTRDRDLLDLESYRDIRMVTPEAFLAELRARYPSQREGQLRSELPPVAIGAGEVSPARLRNQPSRSTP